MTPGRRLAIFGACAAFAVATLWAALAWGSTGFSWTAGLAPWDPPYLWAVRWPRTFLAFGIGSVLALSGASLQGLTRNPLVSPFTLGVSSGAALGAVIALRLGAGALGVSAGLLLFPSALVAGLFTAALLFALSGGTARGRLDQLLLAGVTLSFFSSAAILFIQYTAPYVEAFKMVRWLMGGLDFVLPRDVWMFAGPWALAVALLCGLGSRLNLMTLGGVTAESSGVRVQRLTVRITVATSLAVAAAVATAGPIAFVGILVPHGLRLLGLRDYRLLLPASVVCGGGFLVLCDLIARVALAPVQLPVGVITALLGGPFFLFLLFRMRRRALV
ncbi:MAG: iron ABC transporter [Deltaproteobacteria bacterium HGW-Deltaproteobacteria-17]|nr:MAG: iron ABC transporter [Deltaproteobacteria bacterium HGW-Deltaproteobacteria-17]